MCVRPVKPCVSLFVYFDHGKLWIDIQGHKNAAV